MKKKNLAAVICPATILSVTGCREADEKVPPLSDTDTVSDSALIQSNAYYNAIPQFRNRNELTGKLSGAFADDMMYVKTSEYRTPNASLTWNATRGERIMWADEWEVEWETVCSLMDWDPETTPKGKVVDLYGFWTETFELLETEIRVVPGEYDIVPDNKTVSVCTICNHKK